jgi:exodeoxyribonuclease-5
MSIKFSEQQEHAFRLIKRWYQTDNKRPFVLNGYAGTGKTTIAKHIGAVLGFAQEKVIYVAFTGKAALQLRKKGCLNATTVHRLLYKPSMKSEEKLRELAEKLEHAREVDPSLQSREGRAVEVAYKAELKRVESLSFEKEPDEERIKTSKIIVVDESSMINAIIARDLQDTGLPVIYCGDPFQLPPVSGRSPVSEMSVDIMLTDVHRQALESPVLRFATDLRQHGLIKLTPRIEVNGPGERMQIISRDDANYELYNGHDQILCAGNKTRQSLNKKIQTKKLQAGEVIDIPGIGLGTNDRIIFLNNDHEMDIFNGSIGVVERIDSLDPAEWNVDFPSKYWKISGKTDDAEFEDYKVNNEAITSREKSVRSKSQAIDLAYAITCHKSQGSEWDTVLVHFEPLRDTNMARWLYTSATRARQVCTIVVQPEGKR